MSITGQIRAFQTILVLAVLAIGATVYVAVRGANYYIERVQLSRLQADATTELAVRANRFSEQIAELLLIGEPERPDFEDARTALLAQFDTLRRVTIQDDDLTTDPTNAAEERQEAERLERMRMLVREIDRAVERVLLLIQKGERDAAVLMFRAEIENRLDKEFETLIAEAIEDEREDVVGADATAQRLSKALMIGAFVVLGLLLALVMAAGVLFTRSLRNRIGGLVEGTRAIEQGDFTHRIADDAHDEFGELAGRFNAMSATLLSQRTELVGVRDNLERQVAERTREIASANQQLTELDRQRVRFFGDISHELKTPLTVLRAEAEVALRGASKPEAVYRSALETIVSQTSDIGDLVNDLLFLARSDADQIRFEFRPVSLDAAVAQAVQDGSLLSAARDIRIAVDCPKPAPIVRADPRRLKQALLVMLDNSSRYADPGTEIRVEVRSAGGSLVEIAVSDRGRGIPPDEVALVFERFYRGSRAVEVGGGSGLGLPIARWIAERHDGTVALSSTPGVGTEVRLSLPLAA